VTDLTPTPACRCDITIGDARLVAQSPRRITALAPFDLAAAEALGFPGPGQVKDARFLWAGRGLAFLLDVPTPETLAPLCATTDQSDGWATFDLTGPDAAEILARLVPLDCTTLTGTARSLLGHHPLLIWRQAPEHFTLFTYRSMARSAAHDLEAAMKALAARRTLT